MTLGGREKSLLFGILVLALALRVAGTWSESLWEDEAASYRYAEASAAELLTEPGDPGNPPGYYLLLKAWFVLFGRSEVPLRLLSAVVGVATVLLTFVLGRRLTGSSPVGLVSALLLAVSAAGVHFSLEVRSYALVTLLATASTWALLRCFARGTAGRWTVYAVLAFPMAWLHYQGLFVLFGQGVGGLVWALSRRPGSRGWLGFLAAEAAIAALVAPTVLVHLLPSVTTSGVYDFWQPYATWRDPWRLLLQCTVGPPTAPESYLLALPLSLLAISLPALLLWSAGSKALDTHRLPFLVILYAGAGLFFAAAFRRPIWQEKYLLAFQPMVLVAVATGAWRLSAGLRRARALPALILAISFLPATVHLKLHSPRPDYRAAVRFLLERSPGGAVPVFVHGFCHVSVEHYYPHAVVAEDDALRLLDLAHAAGREGRILLVLSRSQGERFHREMVEDLRSRMSLVREFEANRIRVLEFAP